MKQEKQVFDAFAKSTGGVAVHYELWDPQKIGPALQSAHQSKQMPDVFTPRGVNTPPIQLVNAGWVEPIDLDPAIKASPFPPATSSRASMCLTARSMVFR